MAELQTVFGVEDLYRLMEILTIDAHNQRVAQRYYQQTMRKP